MTNTNTEGEGRKKNSNVFTSALMAGIPLAFIAGLFVGFQLWGEPNVQADEAANTPQRYEIPIYDNDPTLGPDDAVVTIVEFSDYECPYCRTYHWETFGQIIDTYGDQVRYVFKDLPLTSIHPNAVPAAIAAHCASEQDAFWDYHDMLFSMQLGLARESYLTYAGLLDLNTNTFEDCLDSGAYDNIVMEDINVLTNLNAPLSTPTFFINGQYMAGAQPFTEFARLIDAELEAAN
ncbi:MAG TPA: thioredoxin domain-containing protein [Anaerolineales bacterium]|nr:thioredoxin domain-containing protein [Anaerolineales bacterium]